MSISPFRPVLQGSIKDTGTYKIKIYTKNNLGKAERDFWIVVGEKLALTPPMGWNSWNGWGDLVTDENVRTTAKALVETDLINHGWSYVNIDIGWQNARGGKYNALQDNKRFPDMLVVGWVGFGDTILHKTMLKPDELYTHISLWCLWSAPLFIGSPVEKLDEFTVSLLSNDEVLEVDQDPLGRQATREYKNGDAEAWVKNMEDGSKAVGLFNRSDSLLRVEVPWDSIGISGKQKVRDLWRQKNLGTFEHVFGADVRSHGVILLRMFPKD